jgi:2-oxoglutarate/2-oxoacid ferredoxin oxidoreductase subunit alpha
MPRISVKIVGASGQGINSIGAIVAKGLKRSGYCVFGYREYPDLIKGGHASYQLDVSNERVRSTETKVNVLVALNHHGLELNMEELKESGIALHVTPGWQFPERHQKLIKERSLRVIYFPVDDVLTRLGAKAILSNVLLTAFVWSMFDQDVDALKSLVGEKFAQKKALLELNMRCIDEGYSFVDPEEGKISVALPSPNKEFSSHLLVTGSQAMGLGAIHAGVRLYAGYPMTPSSPLLSFIAGLENKTHMVVKQAEDEITAAQIVSGAMYMGTRALTATSGGGFDLMSETVSLNAMIENPTVFVLAQRPGPATGLPTWTAQGDLLQAVNTSHGEFARCVLSVSNSQDAFDLMPVAFNLAEQYQISVIVLTEKQIAEALYTQEPYDLEKAEIHRGKLVTDPEKLKALKSSDRYDPNAEGGISPRWLSGSDAATYCAQGEEHDSMGIVDETWGNIKSQMEKRMRKFHRLKAGLPEPRLGVASHGEKNTAWMDEGDEIELLVIGWGSTHDVIQDVMCSEELRERKIAYLHYTYLWPLCTQDLQKLAKRSQRIVLVEQNYQGQLGMLIRMECGLDIPDKILKYDGRPFFYDELLSLLLEKFVDTTKGRRVFASTSTKEKNFRGPEPAGSSS